MAQRPHNLKRSATLLTLSVGLASATVGVAQDAGAPDALRKTPFGGLMERVAQRHAESALPLPESLAGALRLLASESVAERDSATEALVADATITEEDLLRALRDGALTLEQRDRLALVLRGRFMDADRPALGVSMPNDIERRDDRGVRIDPQINFPACAVLRSDDLVLEIDGISLATPPGHENFFATQTLRTVIMSHLPGEHVTLRLERDTPTPVVTPRGVGAGSVPVEMTIDAPLGRFDDLRQPQARGAVPPGLQQGLNDELLGILPGAWAIRAARMGLGSGDTPIASTAGPDAWVRSTRQAYRPGAGDGIIPGGHAPGMGAVVRLANAVGNPNRRAVVMPNDGGVIRVVPAPQAQPNALPDFIRVRMVETIGEIKRQVQDARAGLTDPTLTPERRQRLMDVITRGEQQIKDLEGRIGAP